MEFLSEPAYLGYWMDYYFFGNGGDTSDLIDTRDFFMNNKNLQILKAAFCETQIAPLIPFWKNLTELKRKNFGGRCGIPSDWSGTRMFTISLFLTNVHRKKYPELDAGNAFQNSFKICGIQRSFFSQRPSETSCFQNVQI
jgi:hypothetical protein